MDHYRFSVRQQDGFKDYRVERNLIEAQYGPLEENSYLFYSAGSSGRLLHLRCDSAVKNKG
ncbi:MAG: hypothetical protein AB1796_01320 [Bacillota bacterium]